MPQKVLIAQSESAGVIECSGSVALAKLLQTLAVETRARIVGVTPSNAAGISTIVLAGGLAEVQHATEHVKTSNGVTGAVFFVRPDKEAMSLLLKSLLIADSELAITKESQALAARNFDISEIDTWNVHELRRYARTFESFPIKGREISKATRSELLRLLQSSENIYPESNSPRAYPPASELRIVN
ncbi:MAG TPA: hypothetical protein VNX68_17325 [Nitrosopumilaceae archaeon]|jgi:hypothetical protein|nr:hypothetical protein [Nitrosopumilaceae archaeon]